MRKLARLFKALAEATRLEIMALLLRHGELCVCDVQEVLGVTQSKASRHLRYLLASGLVRDRRDGLWSYYRVVEDPTPEQATVLQLARLLLVGAPRSEAPGPRAEAPGSRSEAPAPRSEAPGSRSGTVAARCDALEARYVAWLERKRWQPPGSPVCCPAGEPAGEPADGPTDERADEPVGEPAVRGS